VVPDEPRQPATNPRSPTARRSSRPAASPSAAVLRLSRITRPQQRNQGLQTALVLRCVRPSPTTGLHDDSDPSLQLYDDGTFYCFGCRAGGSIYDFAARLWKTGTKRREFLALRQRLHAEFRS
jgi:hypothetical protein